MKLSLICFEYSIKALNINLKLLLILYALKSLFIETRNLIENEYSKQTVITYIIDLATSLTTNKSFQVESIYKHHSDKLSANHSDLVTYYNDMNLTDPTVVSTNYLDLNRIFSLNLLKSSIKLIIFFDLNMACSLVNIMIISYLINKNSKKIYDLFGSWFLYLHLCINVIVLLVLCFISIIYVVLRNCAETDNNNLSFEKKSLFDLIFSYFNDNQLHQSKVYSRYFFDINRLTFVQFNSIHGFLSRIYLKFNVILMIVSTCLLASYSFLLHVDYESIRRIKNSNQTQSKPNSIKLEDSNAFNEKLFLASESLEEVVLCKKFLKKSNIQLQFIYNTILVVFVLSIWDFSDVYYYFNTKTLSPAFSIKNLNENNNILYNRLQELKKKSTDSAEWHQFKSFSYSRDFKTNEDTNFYKRFIYHRRTHTLTQSKEKTNQMKQQYRAFTKIKILFYQNNNKSSRLFCNVLVVVCGLFLLVKLKYFRKLVGLSRATTQSKRILHSFTI